MRTDQAICRFPDARMETSAPILAQLGWRSFFSDQVFVEESRLASVSASCRFIEEG